MSSLLYHHFTNGLPADHPLGAPIDLLYEHEVLPYNEGERYSKPANEANVRAAARRSADAGRMLVVDVECWWLDTNGWASTDRENVDQYAIDRFVKLLTWIKNERPTLKVGIYGIPTGTHGQNLLYPDKASSEVAAMAYSDVRWMWDRPQGQMMQPGRLLKLIDFIAPVMYPESVAQNPNVSPLGYTDAQWWVMQANLLKPIWRMWNRPINLFLSPHYWGSGNSGDIDRATAGAISKWCKANNINRVWWGTFVPGEWYAGAR